MAKTPSRLRELRSAAGLTQTQLAQQVGVRQPHIARWESGDFTPQVPMAIRLARTLNTTVEAIWNEAAEIHERATGGASTTA